MGSIEPYIVLFWVQWSSFVLGLLVQFNVGLRVFYSSHGPLLPNLTFMALILQLLA